MVLKSELIAIERLQPTGVMLAVIVVAVAVSLIAWVFVLWCLTWQTRVAMSAANQDQIEHPIHEYVHSQYNSPARVSGSILVNLR